MKKLDVSQIERIYNKNICLESKWFYKDGLLEFDENSFLYRKLGLERLFEVTSFQYLIDIKDLKALLDAFKQKKDSILNFYIHKYKIWVECVICRNFDEDDAYFGVFRDVTYQKSLEKQLDLSKKKHDVLFNYIDEAVYYVDKNYSLKMINDSAQKHLNDQLLCENFIGEKCYKVYADRDTICNNCKLHEVFESDNPVRNSMHFDFGAESVMLYGKRIKDSDGEIDGAYCIFSDSNEDQYFIQVHKYVNIIKDVAIRKAQLISNISSDLRSNLTVLLGYSKSDILSSLTQEELIDLEQEIVQKGDSIHNLVDELLNVTEIDFNISNLNKVDFDLEFFFSELKLFIDNSISDRFRIDYIESESKDLEIISTDFSKFKQIYLGLISFAIASSQGGSIKLGYTTTEEKKNIIYINFPADNFSEEKAKDLFENLDRNESDSAEEEYRKLLLLTINAFVFVLKLNIQAEYDEQTKHCTISIEYERKAIMQDTEKTVQSDSDILYNRILIAEDNNNNYMLTYAYLNKYCNVIDRAHNGEEAVDLAATNKYDAILMDIQMPIMNGYDATRAIRKNDKDTLIIALTAFIMNNDKELSLEAGCDLFIEKPISKKELLANLKRSVKKR